MRTRAGLRRLLEEDGMVVVPGAHDTLCARIISSLGFPAVYVGSFATAASMLGMTDTGLITLSEMILATRHISSTVDIPIIVDAENGFGNALNVRRTVREFEAVGAAAIHIEDCAFPKHFRGRPDEVISVQEMSKKVKAAVDAREDKDFVIIGRTDAKARYGLDEAVTRCKAYAEAGADMAFIVGLAPEEIADVVKELPVPVLNTNMFTPVTQLEASGLKVVIYPAISLRPSYDGVTRAVRELKELGSPVSLHDIEAVSPDINDMVGMDEAIKLATKFGFI